MTWAQRLRQEVGARAFRLTLVLIGVSVAMGLLVGFAVLEIWTALSPRWSEPV